jgi:hypothetical protein
MLSSVVYGTKLNVGGEELVVAVVWRCPLCDLKSDIGTVDREWPLRVNSGPFSTF